MERHWHRIALEFAEYPVNHPARQALNMTKLDITSIEPRLAVFGVETTMNKLSSALCFAGIVVFEAIRKWHWCCTAQLPSYATHKRYY